MKGGAMHYVNLTPHTVVVEGHHTGKELTYQERGFRIPAAGLSARVCMGTYTLKEINMSPCFVTSLKIVSAGSIVGLPDPVAGTLYIVSWPTLMAMCALGIKRNDVIAPDLSKAHKDGNGRIVSVYGFLAINNVLEVEVHGSKNCP